MAHKGIVTGGRKYRWTFRDIDWLSSCIVQLDIHTVLHGDCPTGADQIVDNRANALHLRQLLRTVQREITIQAFPAAWKTYGLSAGPRRNTVMAAACSPGDFCLHWPGETGTADMCRKAKARDLILVPAHTTPWEDLVWPA